MKNIFNYLFAMLIGVGNVIYVYASEIDLSFADRAFASGDYSTAAKGYARLLANQPNNIDIKTKLAASYHYQSKLVKAEKLLEEVLEVEENFPYALMELAQIRILQNQWDMAKALYQRVINIEPSNSNAYFGLGSVLTRLGDESGADEAFSIYERLTRLQ